MKKIGALVIVFSVLFTITIAPIFADTIPNYSPVITGNGYLDTSNQAGFVQYRVTSLQPYIDNSNFDTMQISDGAQASIRRVSYNIRQDYVVLFTLQNAGNVGNIYIPNPFVGFKLQSPANTTIPNQTSGNYWQYNYTSYGWSISNIDGDISGVSTVGADSATGESFRIMLNSDFYNGGNILLPHAYKAQGSFIITKIYNVIIYTNDSGILTQSDVNTYFDCPASSLTFDSYDIEINSTRESHLIVESLDQIENNTSTTNNILSSINSNVQTITDAYTNNASNVTETQSNISDTNNAEQQLHQAEQNFYQQNEQALQNVGISNFSFSGDESSGLGSVITDFTTLWNNIGPLQIIFTFTLSMSLATFLLRHRPITGAIKKNEKR